jgi:tRNA 2-selenouridine synthase
MLGRLAQRGCQVLDLEALAEHRGSLLGGWPGQDQPSQKLFESRLWAAMLGLDPIRPIIVEAESSKIGDRMIPPALWRAMQAAPRIELTAPLAARARYLVETYGDLAAERARLEAAVDRLPPHLSTALKKSWRALLAGGDYVGFAEGVIVGHYDPAYAQGRRADDRPPLRIVKMAGLDAEQQNKAADEIVSLLKATGIR